MRGALILLALCASAWGQQPPELTRCRAMELWPVYVQTQGAPSGAPAILARLNMYRAAAGLAPVTNASQYNPASQACALVLATNPKWTISHVLPKTLANWTQDAANAAMRSCIDRNDVGAKAVADFIRDWGLTTENKGVGHRRWLLSPMLQSVGVGSVDGALPAVCIYVMTPQGSTKQAVAWPPAGDVPIAWVPERWSYSAPVDVSRATVYVDGRQIACVKANGTTPMSVIVWQPTLAFNVEDSHTVTILGLLEPVAYTVRRFRPQ